MIFLRHGQSEFNLAFTETRKDPGIIDPRLTPLGHRQAQEAAEALASRNIRRLIVSPYTRALQTAAPVAARLGLPLTIEPLVRERYAFTCDIGTPLAQLRQTFPDHSFPEMDDRWWPAEEEPAEDVIARAARFRTAMAEREDWAHTLIISHWGFILSFTGVSVMNGQILEADPTVPPPAEISWRH